MESTLIKTSDGTLVWKLLNGQYHNENGPAVETLDGSRHWYRNGLPHRIDGPASIWYTGHEHYYINGTRISDPEIIKLMTNDSEDQLVLKLKYGCI